MGNKKRGRTGKASYFVPVGSGRYVYSGPLYTFGADNHLTARQAVIRRLVFSVGMTALSAVCGFLPVPGLNNTFYVILPYAGGLISAAVSLWMASRIAYWDGDKLREYVYNSTVKRLPGLTLVCAIFAGLSIACQAVRMIIESINLADLPYIIVFLFTQAAVLTLSLLWKRLETAIVWKKN